MKTKLFKIPLITLVLLGLILPNPSFNLANNQIQAEEPLFEEPEFPRELLIPGRIEGTGTYFEIEDSQYLNVSLKSEKEIKVILESIPGMISLIIEPTNKNTTSTELTLEGLEPNKTYYKYQNSYKNETVFVSDKNGGYSWQQDLTQLHHIWFQEIKGTTFISENTTLNQDITGSVEITANNITLDCAGHKIIGSRPEGGPGYNYGYGIYLNKKQNVTIKNCQVSYFTIGIYLLFSLGNNLINNVVSNNGWYGIHLWDSDNNLIKGNNISNQLSTGILFGLSDNNSIINNISPNNRVGIYFEYPSHNNFLDNNSVFDNTFGIFIWISKQNTLTRNQIFNNKFNFFLYGGIDAHFVQNIDQNNTIDGKPIYYLKNEENKIYDSSTNAGIFYCISCNNITVKDLTLTKNGVGVFFWKTNNSKIENSTISDNWLNGIFLGFSDSNLITRNTFSNNSQTAGSGGVICSEGICVEYYTSGIELKNSSGNIFTKNRLSQDNFHFFNSSNNKFFHNNLFQFKKFPPHLSHLKGGENNFFDNGYPSGGNYWLDYTGIDADGDGIGDTPYIFPGGQDRYPFMKENGWEVPINQPPTISILGQFKSDGIISISEGNITTESTVIFKVTLSDPDNDQVKLQIELKEFNQPFDGINLIESNLVNSGSEAVVSRESLVVGQYKWRARAVDDKGNFSDWQEFGEIGNVDFIIKTLQQAAADLAKEVIDAPYLGDGKTWGGKGYDCRAMKFVNSEDIKTLGYYFYDKRIDRCSEELGKGLDCSGFTFWSYNRAYLEDKIITLKKCLNEKECPIAYEGAAKQYEDNTIKINKEELKPGDLLFFDTDRNRRMDHVAMYIGGEPYNVIHASYFTKTITFANYNTETEELTTRKPTGEIQYLKVSGYGRVAEPRIKLQIIAKSPVDLIITDPEGFIISPENPWEGPMEYQVYDINEDGKLDDIVITGERKIGDYLITVVPEPDALPTDTYSLEVIANGQTAVLAENVLISDIPRKPYIIRSTETEIVPIIPAFVDFDPDTLNLKSKGKYVTAYIELPRGYNINEIDLESIRLNDQISIEPKPTEIGDYDENGIPDIMVKFNRQAVQNILGVGDKIKITVSGYLIDGRLFEGSDIIRVIDENKKQIKIHDKGRT